MSDSHISHSQNDSLFHSACDYYTMLIQKFAHLPRLRTAIVHAVDENSIRSALEAAEEGIIDPVFIAPSRKLEKFSTEIKSFEIHDVLHSHDAAARAVSLAQEGKVQAIMKGKLQTAELMEPVLRHLRTERRASHVMVMALDTYAKPLFLTDVALNIFPGLWEKRDITQNAIDLFHVLCGRSPKVAIISAIEMVTEKLPSTLDAAALCKMAERGQISGAILDGPLGFDNAVSLEAAHAKGLHSSVAGDADILVVPSLESGNFLYKQMLFMSKATGAGIVLGAKIPIILTSRADESELSHKASCAIARAFFYRSFT
jgi:phosphate acetyltransferase